MIPLVDVLIPTYNRVTALSITLTSLLSQSFTDFRVIISDQGDQADVASNGEIQAVGRTLRFHKNELEIHKHLPARGMAEQRQFLLDQAQTPYVLFLDDDLILEPYVIANMVKAIQEEACGFVGSAVIGLSYLHDVRPHEQQIELWQGPVTPEVVQPGTAAWERYRLHNAANLVHVQQRLGAEPQRPMKYRVAWVGGCVLYNTEKLRSAGGFGFWQDLPPRHSGEDVMAQLRVMSRFGGCGLIPSGVYHQELPTTIEDRTYDAPKILDLNGKTIFRGIPTDF